MKLGKEIEIVGGLPVLYIKSLSALVCSDLHLGYEAVLAKRGTFVPKVNLKKIEAILKEAKHRTGAEKVIVVGDIKNEFSEVSTEEFNELNDLIKYIRADLNIPNIVLIKGNHDNFVDRLGRPFGIEIHSEMALFGSFLFFHGEEPPREGIGKSLIMGHIHPTIALYDRIGTKEKLRCFLYGRMRDKREIVILPAMSYFAEGVEVNNSFSLSNKMGNFLEIGEMRALCIGEGEILDFGKVSELENLRQL